MDRTLNAPDGRTLGYADYGDPSGDVLIYHHGGLSCALDIAFANDWCRNNGIRILAPDRPGIRESSPRPGYGLEQSAEDTAALADQLEVERFALAGWSGGGPHAVAGATFLADRVTATATVGSPAPRGESDPGLSVDRFLSPATRYAPGLTRLMISLAARTPGSIREAQTRRSVQSEADRRVIDSLPAGTIASWMDGATGQGPRGVFDDYLATAADWSETARSTPGPVHIFHGTQDHVVPPSQAERLATLIPGGELLLTEGAGHFMLHEHLPEIARALGLGPAHSPI